VSFCCMAAEHDSALTDYFLQRMLPAQGVAGSCMTSEARSIGGRLQPGLQPVWPTMRSRRCANAAPGGARLSRGRLSGRQSGGMVAPIAASRAPNDFVIVCFGLCLSVIDEDRQEVEIEMREKGHSTAEIAKRSRSPAPPKP